MKKIITLGLFLLLSVTVSAQITANGNSGTSTTSYTNGAPNDPIFIWCSEGLGTNAASLTATAPAGGVCTFKWYYHNQANSSWALYATQTGASSTIENLPSDGYRVQIYSAANTLLACYNAWVWNMNAEVTAASQRTGCDTANLSGTFAANSSFTYYNPPPPEAIITPLTQISITFNATHTYISDLAFYLVAPNGTRITLMPNPGVTGNPGGSVCNSGNNVVNFTLTNTSNSSINVCNPTTAPLTGTYGSYAVGSPPVPTPINWLPLYGINAAQGGWAVQIYDCIGIDVGALTNASITFNNLDVTCNGPASITYNSGNINSRINDNSCTPQTASIFQVPVSTVLSTPIVVNATVTPAWTSTGGAIANPASLNTSASGLPEGTTDFTLTGTVTYQGVTCTYTAGASFTREPMVLGEPETLSICGTSPYSFDLTENNDAILNGLDPAAYEITYHNTQTDADNGYSPIGTPEAYVLQVGSQEQIFVRVEDYLTGCSKSVSFVIIGSEQPFASSPPTPQVCDLNNNGSEVFDLRLFDGDALTGQDPNQFVVSYHTTFGGATGNTLLVTSPRAFAATNGQIVYIRITNVDNEACYAVATLSFTVTPTPVVVVPVNTYGCSDDGYTLPALTVGNYFPQPGGQGPRMNAGDVLYTSQTVYVYAESGTSPNNCTDEDSFTVTINQVPVVDEPAPAQACESYFLEPLTVGEYYTGEGGTGDVLAAGTEVTDSTILYIYAETGSDDTVLCSDEYEFHITIENRPVLAAATEIKECDDNYDGIALFDLTPAEAEVINGATDVLVSYHASESDAQLNLAPIAAPEAYQSATSIVYIRVVKADSVTDCYSVAPVQLTVQPKPVVIPISDYVVCDDNNSPDGVEAFDLSTKTAEVTTNPDITVSYYATREDANNEENAIGAITEYESATAPVWVRLESSAGCHSVTSFELVVNPLPVVATDMEPFYACEEEPGEGLFDLDEIEPVVTMGASGYTVAYYATPEDAQNPTEDNYLVTPYLSADATIYVRVENVNTECVTITTADLSVLPAPIAPDQPPLEECDFNNDDVATFNIYPVLDNIMAQMGGTVILTVHETMNDALFGANAIGDNPNLNLGEYTNVYALTTDGVQTLYILVKRPGTFSECFDIVPLQLIVHPVPVATEPEPYMLCDNGTSDTDGIGVFDLTTKEEEILGDIDPAAFSIAFYTSPGDAAGNTNVIPNPATYESANGSVWARVTNNATGCYDVMELELIVNPLPVANDPVPFTLCDYDNPGDEIEVFDLTTRIDEIITTAGGEPQPGIVTTFYHTYEDAVAGTNAIPGPETYTNSVAVETIFVKVALEETGCYRIVLLDVRVEPLPVLVMPTADELTVCDTTGLGIGVFDLDALVAEMINGAPDLVVSFHLTAQDAIDGNNPITEDLANYHNVDPFMQFLYVRVVNTVTGCTNAAPYVLTLIVSPAPQAPEDLQDLVQCDDQDANGQDGKAYFDLTQQDAVIHAAMGTDPATLIIHYFTSEANANNGAPRITSPAHYYGTNGQTIWVRVETPDTECFSVTSFDLELNEPLLLETPSMLIKCDDAEPINDGIAEFDLTVKDEEILGEYGVGQGMTVTYYEVDPRVTTTALPIDNPSAYTNPGPPQGNPKTLYVMVTTPEGCKSYTTLTIKVLPLPQPDLDVEPLVQCDVNNSPDGEEVFDLTDAEMDIRDNDFNMVLTYYETEEDAINRENEITGITAYNSGNATIWVRAEANTQDPQNPVCFTITHFELIVNPLPELGQAGVIEPYAICEQNTDGIATFDFNTHMDEILGNAADPADYTVKFFRDQAALDAGTAMPYIYTNTAYPGHQQILVQVRHNETGCTTTAPLDLYVEEAAIANPVTETFFECDYEGNNDGVFTFDLTRADDDALGTQNPADYSVSYYTSLEDAVAGTNAIADPAAYQNTNSPDYQMIWVRVTNESTISKCYDITTLNLFVERIPEPSLTGGTICVNFITQAVLRDHPMDTGLDATHTFVWYHDGVVIPGATGPAYTAEAAGEYTVVATSATGCVSDPIAPVTVTRSGPASPIGDGYAISNAFSDEQTIVVLAEGYGEYQYQLDDGPWQNSNVFNNVSAGLHEVHVRDVATNDPCDEFNLFLDRVSVIDYPNFFTPNGDGYNDSWNVVGLGDPQYRAVIYIFDRYGKLLKQLSPSSYSEGWNGTYNGAQMPADDYWFTVTYEEGGVTKEFKAHFALKR